MKAKAEGTPPPAGDGSRYDSRGYRTIDGMEEADINGDGHIDNAELNMHLEFKRKELEDADAMRDAQRRMAWFALGRHAVVPVRRCRCFTRWTGTSAGYTRRYGANLLCSSCWGIVAAFFGAQAFTKGK